MIASNEGAGKIQDICKKERILPRRRRRNRLVSVLPRRLVVSGDLGHPCPRSHSNRVLGMCARHEQQKGGVKLLFAGISVTKHSSRTKYAQKEYCVATDTAKDTCHFCWLSGSQQSIRLN